VNIAKVHKNINAYTIIMFRNSCRSDFSRRGMFVIDRLKLWCHQRIFVD